MKKIVGLILFVVVLLGAGCSGKATGKPTGNEATPSPRALPVKKVNCIDLPKQVPGASHVRFEVSDNCALDHPVRVDKDNIVIVGNGATLIRNHDNAESLDGFIVSSRNVIIDGFNFQGFQVPIFVEKGARAIIRNIRINDIKRAGIAIADMPQQNPSFQKADQQAPIRLNRSPLFRSFEWISTARADVSCNGISGKSLCEVATRVLDEHHTLELGHDCPELTLCGEVLIGARNPNSSAIYVGNASTLGNRADLTITVDSASARGLTISGSTVNLEETTNINNTSGRGIYFDRNGGTLTANAVTTIQHASNAIICDQRHLTTINGSLKIEEQNANGCPP